jgi:RNA polymerase sigma factor (TIGR02999 family)
VFSKAVGTDQAGACGGDVTEITTLLQRLQNGNRDVMHDVIPLVYDELKKLARSHLRREWCSTPFQTTALVHEAFLKLAASRQPGYENRSHFYGIVSRLMRQVLVDTARARTAEKRNAGVEVPLADFRGSLPQPDRSLLGVDDVLQRLERIDPLKAKLIEMRYFAGMTAEESARAVAKPVHVVNRELRFAKAWLRQELGAGATA